MRQEVPDPVLTSALNQARFCCSIPPMIRERVILAITGVGALFFLVFGLWPFFDARSFFDSVAEFEPYNAHFLHDVGAFQIGIGATLAFALWRRTDALFAALAGAGIGAGFHTAAHILDHDRGGQDSDPFVFGALALALLGAAAWKLVAPRRSSQSTELAVADAQ